jgi:hypothetical protein
MFPLRFVTGADVFIEDRAGHPARFLFETMKGLRSYFSTRSLASDCPIELNTDKVWFGSVTRKNLSVRFQCGDLVFLIGAPHHEYVVRQPPV